MTTIGAIGWPCPLHAASAPAIAQRAASQARDRFRECIQTEAIASDLFSSQTGFQCSLGYAS
jgi:hypothetical protein